MAKYPSMVLTKEGLSMIAESQGGQGLIFTHIEIGMGDLNEASILELTNLFSSQLKVNISEIDAASRPGQVTLTAVVSNSGVEKGFHTKEVGVFAKIGETGTERLYAYTNAGNYADFMPDKTDPTNEVILKFTFVVSNAQNIAAVIDESIVYSTIYQMQNAIDEHNTDPEAHANLKLAGVPVGSIIVYPAEELPEGFMPCDGTYLDRETYQDLFNVIGTKYGEGDGMNTFNLPDLRGYFVRSLDDGKGIDQGRELGSVQGDAIRNIKGAFSGNLVASPFSSEGAIRYIDSVPAYTGTAADNRTFASSVNFDASLEVPTADENRPKNIALVYAIKVFGAATNTGQVDVAKLAESVAELTNTLQQPAGSVLAFAGKKPPSGYLVCDGGEVGRATYPDLFEAIGTIYGAGDGKETFNLPDLRGQFLRGLGGNSAELGEQQGDAIRNITGTFLGFDIASDSSAQWTGAFKYASNEAGNFVAKTSNDLWLSEVSTIFNAGSAVPTAEENRPRNMAILYCIKAFGSKTNVGQIDLTELANEMKNKTNYTDFASSHTKAGYQLFPNGGIRQRGVSAKLAPNSGVAVVLPLAMPDENYTVSATPIAVGPSSAGNGVGIVINNSSQFTIYNWGPIDIAGVHWTAEW